VQNLEIKNRVLRTFSDLRCDIKMDLNKMFVGKKVYDKTGLGYAEMSSSSAPKKTRSPEKNGGQSQKSVNKSDNMKSTKYHKENLSHAYQYKYSNRG
jgi:hypothetical protein